MLAQEAETVAVDARHAGLFQVHIEQQAAQDKCSWVVRGITGTGESVTLRDVAALAAYLRSPNLHKALASQKTPAVQQDFIDSYGERFGHFTAIQKPEDPPVLPLATA